ncbi:hypothetical protein AAHC03_016442 [Spirometra sp. Aus1]
MYIFATLASPSRHPILSPLPPSLPTSGDAHALSCLRTILGAVCGQTHQCVASPTPNTHRHTSKLLFTDPALIFSPSCLA